MENILFWTIVIITSIWSFGWLTHKNQSLGHKTMIIPIILLWGLIIYFYKNNNLSKYHMIWLIPVIIILEMIISMILFKVRRYFLIKKELMKTNLNKK